VHDTRAAVICSTRRPTASCGRRPSISASA
jgi:hypothetical protein